MLISRKVDYAIRVLSKLAASDMLVSTAELAKELRISKLFLAKIINELSRAGIVSSQRGKNGGIVLKDPRTSLKTVIFMFDPNFSLNKCLRKGNKCFMGRQCLMHKFLAKAQADLLKDLESMSIGKMAI